MADMSAAVERIQAAIDRKAQIGGTARRQVHRRLRELSRKRGGVVGPDD